MTIALDGWGLPTSPFHLGEQEMQRRVGVAEKMAPMGRRMIRRFLPDQHRAFYAQLPTLFVGHLDEIGRPWASILVGEPGFVTSPDVSSLSIRPATLPGDPLRLTPGRQLGMVGVEFPTRRRNRANGVVTSVAEDGTATVTVSQTFGNCPQYIHTRAPEVLRIRGAERATAPVAPLEDGLDQAAKDLIERSDTFFVATAGSETQAGVPGTSGVDMSHRGGRPGFVKVEGNRLTIPDYAGNLIYNTLGNILVNPVAGLLFYDPATGDVLMVTGTAEIIEDGPEIEHFAGAERLWIVDVVHRRRLPRALPIRWSAGDGSPNNQLTGTWAEAKSVAAAHAARNSWRRFRVGRVVVESESVRSFHLEPSDGGALLPFQSGQFLPIRAEIDGREHVRTYTLSSAPGEGTYRISVKRDGVFSQWLHEALVPGLEIEARAPRGDFRLDPTEKSPAVLIAGGIGITPMLSMIRNVALEGLRSRHIRPLTLIYSAGTAGDRAFHQDLAGWAEQSGGALRYVPLLTQPEPADVAGRDYAVAGRLSDEVLKAVLPLDDYSFYLCGPPGFMQTAYDALMRLGVRDSRIHAEAFGPASLTRVVEAGDAARIPVEEANGALVRFESDGVEQVWSPKNGSLLEFAESHGMAPEFGCRNGSCGSCAVPLRSGDVAYRTKPTAQPEDGEILLCCAVPAAGTGTVTLG